MRDVFCVVIVASVIGGILILIAVADGVLSTRERKASENGNPQIDWKESHDKNTPSVPRDDPDKS